MDTSGLKQQHINEMGSVAIRKHELLTELEQVDKRLYELTFIVSTIEHIESLEAEDKNKTETTP